MLQVRYHQNYTQQKDAILFTGSRKDILRLRHFFAEWDGENIDLISHLKEQGQVYQLSVRKLSLTRDRIKKAFYWKSDQGTWIISENYQATIVDALDDLISSDTPGHKYIDYVDVGRVQILVSMDEPPLNGSGKPIESIVRSKQGFYFSVESVPVLREHVRSFERDQKVPYLSVRIDEYNQSQVMRAGNDDVRPNSIRDELDDLTFYWRGDRFAEYRATYFVDLEFQRKAYFLPLPDKPMSDHNSQ